jgi:arylsulfatase A-like enzyme
MLSHSPGVISRNEAVRLALATGLSLGLALGLLDLTLSLVRRPPPAFARVATVWLPLAVSSAAFFLMIAPVLAILALLPGSIAPSRRVPLLVACATGLGTGLVLAVWHDLTRLEQSASARTTSVFVACLSLALGAHGYLLARATWRDASVPPGIRAVLLSLPSLMGTVFLFTWGRAYLPKPRGSPLVWNAVLATALVVVATVSIRLSRRAHVGRWLAGFGALIVLAAAGAAVRGIRVSSRQQSGLAQGGAHSLRRVLLLSIDTLRVDAVSALDPGAPPTPNLDSLARDSMVFTQAYSPAPWTLAAFVSVMTGVSPGVHGVKSPHFRIPEALPTVAERMRDAGYVTAAIGHNPWLRREHGMSRGFSSYDVCPRDDRGGSLGSRLLARLAPARLKPTLNTDELTDLSVAWLRQHAGEDFFLWLHYFKPHGPYEPPPPYRPRASPPPGMGYSFGGAPEIRVGSLVILPDGRLWARQLYQGEVRLVDDNVGRVLGELKRLGIYDDALIVLVSDHGEEFWEHGSFEHGHTLYQELIHVPFFVKLPGASVKGRRDEALSTGSFAPTLVQLARLPADPEAFSYPSLGALLGDGGTFEKRPTMSSAPLYYEDRESVLLGKMKYIHSLNSEQQQLFDLIRDPLERHDVAESSPEAVRSARQALAEAGDADRVLRARYHIQGGSPAGLNPGLLEQLRSLGYVR